MENLWKRLTNFVIKFSVLIQSNKQTFDLLTHVSMILQYYSSHAFPEFSGTAEVLQIFRNWFNIVNVKSLSSKALTKDEYRAAVMKGDRELTNFFYKCIGWLRKWMASEKNRSFYTNLCSFNTNYWSFYRSFKLLCRRKESRIHTSGQHTVRLFGVTISME